MTTSLTIPSFDPMSPSFLDDPNETFRHYREIAAAYRHEESWPTPVVSILSHAAVKSAFRDYDTFSSFVPEEARTLELGDAISMAGEDPPVHTRLRSVVSRGFAGRAMRVLEGRVREIVDECFDDALERGEVDVVEDLGARIAVRVIGALLGVPDEDLPIMRQWTKLQATFNGASFWLTGPDDPNIERYTRITAEIGVQMQDYFAALHDERARRPRNDLISTIADSELERQEAISLAKVLLLAGNDTTMNLMNNATKALIDHRDQEQLLRSEPERVSATVEETLRFAPPIQWSPRTALSDTEIDGVPINEGEGVVLWIGSANRDARVYDRPNTFDISRNPDELLVSFGLGPHACIGSILARLEGRVFLETLVRRTSAMERTSSVMPTLPTPAFRGVGQQIVRFTPR